MLGAVGLALLVVRHPLALSVALAALGVAAALALDHGAPAATAPLWGVSLLTAGALAERALVLPADAEVEADALVDALAGLGALAGVGLAAGALVLLAGTTSGGATVAGLAAGAVLAVVPAGLERRRTAQGGRP